MSVSESSLKTLSARTLSATQLPDATCVSTQSRYAVEFGEWPAREYAVG
jgi:hypothetical protein